MRCDSNGIIKFDITTQRITLTDFLNSDLATIWLHDKIVDEVDEAEELEALSPNSPKGLCNLNFEWMKQLIEPWLIVKAIDQLYSWIIDIKRVLIQTEKQCGVISEADLMPPASFGKKSLWPKTVMLWNYLAGGDLVC